MKSRHINSLSGEGLKTIPSDEEHYEFLKKHYRPEFFEGRNNSVWGADYSYNLARSDMVMLEKYGYSIILKHESLTGETIYYDRSLTILFGERIIQAMGVNILIEEYESAFFIS